MQIEDGVEKLLNVTATLSFWGNTTWLFPDSPDHSFHACRTQ